MARMFPGGGGWALYQDDEGNQVHVLFREDDEGKLRIYRLMLAKYDGNRIDGDTLRRLRLGQIERMANGPDHRDALIERMGEQMGLEFRIGEKMLARRRLPKIPNRKPYPDTFYRAVLTSFGELSAAEIAEHYGVDIGRVYGWIQAARDKEV